MAVQILRRISELTRQTEQPEPQPPEPRHEPVKCYPKPKGCYCCNPDE